LQIYQYNNKVADFLLLITETHFHHLLTPIASLELKFTHEAFNSKPKLALLKKV